MNLKLGIASYLLIGYINFFLAMNIVNPTVGMSSLPDIGFYYLPSISMVLTDAIICTIYAYFFIKWFYVNKDILARFFYLCTFLFIIRTFTFTVTYIPPCVPDCVSRKDGEDFKWFTFSFDQGCSDHMFSGHSVHITLFLLFTLYHSQVLIEKILISIIYLPYLFMIIASRLHYTVDVIIGVLLTMFLYYIDSEGLFLDKIRFRLNQIKLYYNKQN